MPISSADFKPEPISASVGSEYTDVTRLDKVSQELANRAMLSTNKVLLIIFFGFLNKNNPS